MEEPTQEPGRTASGNNAHEHGNCNLCDDLEEALEEAQGKLRTAVEERNEAEQQGATLVTQLLEHLHCEVRPADEAAIKAEGRDMLGCEDDTAIESWCVPCQIRAKWR